MLIRQFQKELEKRLVEKAPLIQILLGPRQVGKTTAAKAIFDNWDGSKLMITADSPSPPLSEWITWNWEKALSLGKNCLFIIDEVQKVTGWSEQIKALFDAERGKGNLKILLLGSSSLYLQRGLHESLAGRFELVRATHWSFKEFNEYFNWDFKKYMKHGAYPGAEIFANDEERWRNYILNSIIEPVLSRDILSQSPVTNPALFRQTFELTMRYPSQVVSFQKLLGQLQDRGNAATIKHYLSLLEKSFLIKTLQKYSGSEIRTRTSSPKIVILNPALINAYQQHNRLDTDQTWFGCVFESIMGAHLNQIPNAELFYWRKGQLEVDFVLKKPGEIVAIEIKSGRAKSMKGLREFSKQYPNVRCEIWSFNDCMNFLKI